MDDLATLSAFDSAQQHLQELTRDRPNMLVTDEYPLYRSSAWPLRNDDGWSVRTVLHHHAHITAVMGEHGLDDRSKCSGSRSTEGVTT